MSMRHIQRVDDVKPAVRRTFSTSSVGWKNPAPDIRKGTEGSS
jgi:hypothetical protein